MTKKQALDIIKQVVEAYKGTLQEHRTIQQAMQVLQEDINAKIKEQENGTQDKIEKKTSKEITKGK